jgi:hypothetical protein
MDRNAAVLAGSAMIAGALALGFWYRTWSSPFERCVRAKGAEYSGESIPQAKAETLAIEFCLKQAR